MQLSNLTSRVLPVLLGLLLCTSINAHDKLIFNDIKLIRDSDDIAFDPSDSEPPIAVCAPLGTVTAALDENGIATVNAESLDGGSTDNVGIASFHASPATFDCGDLGIQSVTLTVTDTNGNTATCVTDVQVVDLLGPVLSVNEAITVILDANGNAVIDPNMIDIGTSDNCGISTISVSHTSLDCSSTTNLNPIASDLIISEYVDGSDNNKYIEIYNGTGVAVDMADYFIELFYNGAYSTVITDYLGAAGILESGEAAVFSNAQATLYSGAHYNSSVADFDGNDMLMLWHSVGKQATVIDVFGLLDENTDPSWDLDGVSTKDHTLRRKKHVVAGNVNLSNTNFLSEWEQFDSDDVSDLGSHNFEDTHAQVIFSATDNSGNTTTKAIDVFVIDTIAPKFLSQPDDIIMPADMSGDCAQYVYYTIPEVKDNCSGEVVVTSDYPSGDVFLGGETLVTLTATDAGGNTDQVQFTVNILYHPLTVSIVSSSDTVCSEGPLYLNAYVLGGCGEYTYEWNGKHRWYSYIEADTAGLYHVLITDANGDTASASITTYPNSPIEAEVSMINPSCADGHDGSMSVVSISGGTGPYRYHWYGSQLKQATGEDELNGVTSVTGLSEGGGVYLGIRDKAGCGIDFTFKPKLEDRTPPTAICGSTTLSLDADGTAMLDPADLNAGSTDDCSASMSFSASQETFDCANLGVNNVLLYVADESLNTSTCLAYVTVIDNIAPVFTSFPENGAATANTSNCSAIVTWEEPTATDNCDVTITSTHNSGDAFPVGVTTVTYTAADLSGNTVTQSFTVAVTTEDVVVSIAKDQDILCHADMVHLTAVVSGGCLPYTYSWNGALGGESLSANGGMQTLTVTDANGTSASANITLAEPSAMVATISSIEPDCPQSTTGEVWATVSGGTAPYTIHWSGDAIGSGNSLTNLGSGTYTATITDNNGCTTIESVTLSDADTTPPTAICGNATLTLDANGQATLDLNAIDGGSADNCGSVSVTASQTAFDCGDLGANNITLTVTDESGLTSTCTATVTVVDNVAPEVVAQNINLSLDINGFALIAAADIDNGSNDNCGIATLEITSGQVQYGCADEGQTFAVTLTATDNSGNTSSAVAQVTVESDNAICDPIETCAGAETIISPNQPCDYQTTINTGFLNTGGYMNYCVYGPFTDNYIVVAAGTTVRLTGTGTLRINVLSGAAVEVMAGSDITITNLILGWNARGMVVNAGATVHMNNFQPGEPIVNCGTMNCDGFSLGYNSSFLNNGTLNSTTFSSSSNSTFTNNGHVNVKRFQLGYGSHFENNGVVYADQQNGNNSIKGSLVNYGAVDLAGNLEIAYNGSIVNHCTINVDADFKISSDVTNYSLISVGRKSTLDFSGRVFLYNGAMFQTSSTHIGGKYIGYGSPSLVKVANKVHSNWGARVEGSIYFCALNGIASSPFVLFFKDGAQKSCDLAIPVTLCNQIGHFVTPMSLIASTDNDASESNAIIHDGSTTPAGLTTKIHTQESHTHKSSNAITVFPNPTQGKAQITFTPQVDASVTISVYNVRGKKVMEFKPSDQIAGQPYVANVDISKYENGVYLIQIMDQTQSETRKLVLSK